LLAQTADQTFLIDGYSRGISDDMLAPIEQRSGARHTSAILLLAADVNINVASQRLGHQGIRIILQYYVHALRKRLL
jgi:integrase